ncbi:hypothetical protein MAR_020022, partial [Mya arenaria]
MASKQRPSVLYASDEIHDFSCSVCKDDNLNIEAKHFCGDCSKYYCDKCLTFHAKIHKHHVVLGCKDVDKWVGQGDALVTCNLHPPKVIELLCEDHNELCCHLCVPLNHRMCGSISLISDLVKGIYKMTDFKQLPAKVTKVTDRLNQVKEARKKNQNSLNTSGNVLADLNGSLQKDIDHCDLLHDQLKALLDTVQAQGKESSSYIGFKKCEDKMEEANRLLHEIENKQEATITFQPDTHAQQLLSDLKALANIHNDP